MTPTVILGPDVYVNASVALGSAPEQVVARLLPKHRGALAATPWILERVEAMLSAVPSFRKESVGPQVNAIRGFLKMLDEPADAHRPDAWRTALVAAAKRAGVTRVITDHPDLADQDEIDGVEFLSSEAWLLEQTTPPPIPA